MDRPYSACQFCGGRITEGEPHKDWCPTTKGFRSTMCDAMTNLPAPGTELFLYRDELGEVGDEFEIPMGILGDMRVRIVKVKKSQYNERYATTVEAI